MMFGVKPAPGLCLRIHLCSQASVQSPGHHQEDGAWGRTVAVSAVWGVLRAAGGHGCPLCAVWKRRWTFVLFLLQQQE